MNLRNLACGCLVALVSGAVSLQAAEGNADPNEYPGRLWPDAEEVLNGRWRAQFPPPFPAEVHYDVPGFAEDRLTPLPEPGVHPRILMTPADVERLRAEYRKGEDAGFVFKAILRLLRDRAKEDPHRYAPFGGNADWDWCPPLKAQAFLALVTEDGALGRDVARQVVAHAEFLEPRVDTYNRWEESRGNFYYWRHARQDKNPDGSVKEPERDTFTQFTSLAFEYDYIYPWLNEEERAQVRRVLSKMTYGKYASQMEMPGQFNINNHMALNSQFICIAAAIEGEEGSDDRILPLMIQCMEDQLTYNISKDGIMYESVKGSTPGLSILTAARRRPDLLRHSHLYHVVETAMRGATYFNQDYMVQDRFRKQILDPADDYQGQWQTFGGGSREAIFLVKYFYPDDPAIDLVYKSKLKEMNVDVLHLNQEQSAEQLAARAAQTADFCLLLAADGFTTPDGRIEWYGDNRIPDALQEKPLTWSDMDRGYMVTRDRWGPESMIVFNKCRTKVYYGGHETGDHGEFSMVHNGYPWIVEPLAYGDPIFHNQMLVDGLGCGYPSAGGKMVCLSDFDEGTTVVNDIAEGYKWQLVHGGYDLSHPMYTDTHLFNFNKWLVWTLDRTTELPTHASVRQFYEGYAHKDYGSWHGENRGVVRYKKWNPMEYYFRTLHVARGKYPYLLIVDDAKKDGQPHPYEWGMMLHKDARLVSVNNAAKNRHEWLNCPPSQIGTDMIFTMAKGEAPPKTGDPMLLVRVLWRNSNVPFPTPNFQKLYIPPHYPAGGRVTIPAYAVDPQYRVLVYPYTEGDPLPLTRWNEDRSRLFVSLDGQADEYDLAYTDGGADAEEQGGRRVALAMIRNGQPVAHSDARPPRPVLAQALPLASGATRNPSLLFDGRHEIRLNPPAAGQVVRYTLDGSEPTEKSPVYKGPVVIEQSLNFKAKTFASYWPYGDTQESPVLTADFERRDAAVPPPVDRAGLVSGLVCTFHELRKDIYDPDGFFSGRKGMLPDLANFVPNQVCTVDGLTVPETMASLSPERMANGYYTYSGYITVPTDGVYRFKLNAPGPIDLRVGGQQAIYIPGPYNLSQKDFYGEAVLKAGTHAFALTVTDPVYWKGRMEAPLEIDLAAACRTADGEIRAVDLRDAFSRMPGIEFAGPLVFVERGALEVTTPLNGELMFGINSAHLKRKVGKGIALETPGLYRVNVGRFVGGKQVGPVLTRIVRVVPRSTAVEADTRHGLVKNIYDVHELAPSDRMVPGNGVHPEMFRTQGRHPFNTRLVDSLNGDDVIVGMTEYQGFLEIQAEGIYEFELDTEGANQLYIGDLLITENRVERKVGPAALSPIIFLEAGLHPVSFRLVHSRGVLKMRPFGTDAFTPLSTASLLRPKHVDTDDGATLMARLDLGAAGDGVIPVEGQHGAEARYTGARVVDSEHGPALSGEGKVTLRNLRTFHNGLTLSMWVRPKKTERITFMGSRLPTIDIRHWGDKIDGFLYPDGSSAAGFVFSEQGVEIGEWFHLAFSFGHANSVYVNGKRVGQSPIDWSVVRYSEGRLRNEEFTIDLRGGDICGVQIFNEDTTGLALDPKYIPE